MKMNDLVQILNEAGNFISSHESEMKVAAAAVLISALPVYYGVRRGIKVMGEMFDRIYSRREYEQLEDVRESLDSYL